MRSQSTDVEHYLQEVQPERRACLVELRKLCQHMLTDFEEVMDHGMPCYKKDGRVKVAFASQKRHISLYLLQECVIENNMHLLKGLSFGKCCVRYSTPEKMDFDVIKKLLFDSHNAQNLSC